MQPSGYPRLPKINKYVVKLLLLLIVCCYWASTSHAQPDQVMCPPDVTLSCFENRDPFPGDPFYNPNVGVPTVLIPCELVSFTYQDIIIPGSCNGDYAIERHWDGSGECGASLECVQLLQVEDNSPPTAIIITQPLPTLECSDPNVPALLMAWANTAATTANTVDDCGGGSVTHNFQLNQSPIPLANCFSSNSVEYYVVDFIATDDCGNVFNDFFINVFVEDHTAPQLNCSDLTLLCSDPMRDQKINAWLSSITAIDACRGVVPVISDYDPTAFAPFDNGQSCGQYNQVEFTAEDDCGNESGCIGTIYLIDDAAPVINMPADLYLECNDPDNATAIGNWMEQITILDECTIAEWEIIEADPVMGSCPGNTVQLITVRAVDDCGNENIQSASIFIEDTTPPRMAPYIHFLTLPCGDPNNESQIQAYLSMFSAFDRCDPNVVLTNSYSPTGFNYPCGIIGDQAVVFTATDACGNSSTFRTQISITPELPTIGCYPDQFITCLSDIDVPAQPAEFSSCLAIASSTVSAPILVSGVADCDGAVYEVTRTIIDICDQQASCTERYIIQNEGPVVNCAAGFTVNCFDEINVSPNDVSYSVSCGQTPTIIIAGPFRSGAADCPGTIYTYRYTVTDACNRSATCERQFRIDNAAPQIMVEPFTVVECVDDIEVHPDDAQLVVSCDLDAVVNISDPVQQGVGYCPGTTFRYTYTVQDGCGRTASAERVFQIENEGPQIIAAPDITVHCIDDIHVSTSDIGVVTACDQGYTVQLEEPELHPDYNCISIRLPYVYTVTDACGRTAMATRWVTVEHKNPFIATPEPLVMDCLDMAVIEGHFPFAYSYCGGLEYTIDISEPEIISPEESDCSYALYTVIYSVFDDCGVMICVSMPLTIENEVVLFREAPEDVTVACDSIPDVPEITAHSACGGELDIDFVEHIVPEAEEDYTIQRIWRATSLCGGTAEHIQEIYVNCDDSSMASSRLGTSNNKSIGENEEEVLLPMQVFPNPVRNDLQLGFELNDAAIQQAKVRVFSIEGREVFASSFAVEEGANRIRVGLGALPAGSYIVQVSAGDFTFKSQRFIKAEL